MSLLLAGSLLAPAGPAAADGSGLPVGPGGVPAGTLGSGTGTDLGSAGYSLSQVDPLTQTMSMGELGVTMGSQYALTEELADSGQLAIDAADLARTARLAEEARRAALAAGARGTGLRAGAVPARYEPLVISAVSDQCPQLPASLLAAQLEAESAWNPHATSSTGAQGIAQFMPATWARYGLDGDGDGSADVWNPADAIPTAARYDCQVRDAVRNVPGDPDANMLAAYNAGPGAVIRYGGVPPYAETRGYVDRILSRAAEMADAGGAGDAGTAAGCPTTAPAGTLRDGAETLGVARICADSVAKAPTPEAARAIKFALRNLGAPYSQAQRMDPGYFDCSSFVMRSYQAAGANVIQGGWAPNTYAIENVPWAHSISFGDKLPGDLVYPFPGHITMALADGLKVHTNRPGDVSHVNAMYTSAYLTLRVDPSRIPG